MASSGKKGKKSKGTVISLQSFLSNGSDQPIGTTQVAKKVRNYDGDDSDDGGSSLPLVFQLPTAPRANRIFEDESIPQKPPFLAYVTNLPFDVNDDDIYSFFDNIPIVSLRLPREDGETGRVRGFGYVEFETRDDLIHVLSLPDPTIKGRRIRIDLSNENEQQSNRQRSNRRGYDGFGNNAENRDSTNWRRDNQNQESSSFDRGFNRERRIENAYDSGAPGSWRSSNRSVSKDISPNRSIPMGERYRDVNIRNKIYENDRERGKNFHRHDEEIILERPKLNLKPRTLPLPEINTISQSESITSGETNSNQTQNDGHTKPTGSTPLKVFGAAKPVDTASRELEIEERLAQTRRDEKIKYEQEQKKRENEVFEKFAEVQLEKPDKENTNSAISWRNRDELAPNGQKKNMDKGISRKSNDDKRKDNKDIDNEKTDFDRSDQYRDKSNQGREGKQKDDSKPKREIKLDPSMPKLQQNHPGPVLQTSNKYSGLDDDDSD